MRKKLLSALSLLILTLTLALSCSEDNGISKVFQEKRYESAGHVTDPRDGQTYRTVKIGNLTWTAENMKYKTDESWCYDGLSANCEGYGRLYSWKDAAAEACPAGWHLPANSEWRDLMDAVGSDSRQLRDKRWGGADRHGFSALAGGRRGVDGVFFELGSYANWWSFTAYSVDSARYWEIAGDTADKFYGELYYDNVKKAYGMSARCVEGAVNYVFVTFEPGNGVDAPYTLGVARGQNLSNWDLPLTARPGYVFEGWFSSEAGKYNPNAPVTQNQTFAGMWRELPKYTITFDRNGGAPAVVSTVSIDSGLTIGEMMPANPEWAAHTFEGWFDENGVQHDNKTVIGKTALLTAKWREWPKYTVAFNLNGWPSNAIGDVTVDSSFTLGANFPTVSAYSDNIFVGWFDGNIMYDDSTVIVKTVMLTAKWINVMAFSDSRDGKTYRAVSIGGKMWMAENLNYTTSDSSYSGPYGRLYAWNAARDACPAGWHLPTRQEWIDLATAAGGASEAGTALKATSDWKYNGNGTDEYGFSALPGNYRNLASYSNSLGDAGIRAYWWTSSRYSDYEAYYAAISYGSGEVTDARGNRVTMAYAVRCVQN